MEKLWKNKMKIMQKKNIDVLYTLCIESKINFTNKLYNNPFFENKFGESSFKIIYNDNKYLLSIVKKTIKVYKEHLN